MQHRFPAARGKGTGTSPIIIIGMHRSGTGMLSGMLQQLGLFIGMKLDSNNEAPLFVVLNDWLLHQSGATWQNPDAIRYLLDNPAARAAAADHLQRALTLPRVARYLGWRSYARYHTPANLDLPWGWKDPRTTYTLPLWLDLFPAARVIHIYRHGVDVARSLSVRGDDLQVRGSALHARRKLLYWAWPQQGDLARFLSCMPLERGFALWESYVTQARAHVHALGNRACEVRYEDVLAAPERTLRALAAFCDLPANPTAIARAARQVRPERAYAHRSRPELHVFAERVAARLNKMGYPPTARCGPLEQPASVAR